MRLIYEVMKEIKIEKNIPMTKNARFRRKILHQDKIPPEVDILFRQLEDMGYEINELPTDQLRQSLKRNLSLIERSHDLDQELVRKVGWEELVNWRLGKEISDETLYLISQLFKEDVVPGRLPTRQEVKGSRAKFFPTTGYHQSYRHRSDKIDPSS